MMTRQTAQELMPGERVVWEGRPEWRVLARDVLKVRWIAGYFALYLLWGASIDRGSGLGPVEALVAGMPLFLLGLGVLGGCAGLAWGCAATTHYTITTERCVLRFGMALTATLSVPLRQIAGVSVSVNGDGTGDIPLALKPGRGIAFAKLWPHARPWRFSRPQPMLRGVADAAAVAAALSQAVAAVTPGRLGALSTRRRGVIEVDQAGEGGGVVGAEGV